MALNDKIGSSAAFCIVLVLLMAAILMFVNVVPNESKTTNALPMLKSTSISTRNESVVPFIDVDDNSTKTTDHDGLKIVYKSASSGGTYMIKAGESRNANNYEKATVRVLLHGEGDSVSGGEGGYGPVDVVFAVDDTGSMGSYITQAASDMKNIIAGLQSNGVTDMRFGVVSYKDGAHDSYQCWQDDTWSSGTPKSPPTSGYIDINVATDLRLTSNSATFISTLNSLVASGGADGPEAPVDALQYAYDSWKYWDDVWYKRSPVSSKYNGNYTMNWDTYRNGHSVAKVVIILSDWNAHGGNSACENATKAYNEYGITTNAILCSTYANSSYYQPAFKTVAQGATAKGNLFWDIAKAGNGIFSTSNNPTYMANKISESILRVAEKIATAGKSVNMTYDVPSHITVSTMSQTPLKVTVSPGGSWSPVTGVAVGPCQIIWNLGNTFNIGDQKSLSWDVVSSKASAVHATTPDIEFGDLELSYYAWNQATKSYGNFVKVKMGEGYLSSDKPGGSPQQWQEQKLMVKAITKITIIDVPGADLPIYAMSPGETKQFKVKDVLDQLGATGNSMISHIDLDQLRWDTLTDAGSCSPVKCTDSPTDVVTTTLTCAMSGRIACVSTSGVIGQKLISVPELLAKITMYTKEDTTTPAHSKTISVTVDKTQAFVAKGFNTAGGSYSLTDTYWIAKNELGTDITSTCLPTGSTGTEVTFKAPSVVGNVTLTVTDRNGTTSNTSDDKSDSCIIYVEAGGIAHLIVVPNYDEFGVLTPTYVWNNGPVTPKTTPIYKTTIEAGTKTRTFRTFAYDEYWNKLPSTTLSYTWTSDVGSMIPGSGKTSELQAQTTLSTGYVYASRDGIIGRCQVEVVPGPLAKIVIVPDMIAIQVGNSWAFTAKGYDAAGNLKTDWVWDGMGVVWTASDASTMTKTASGYEYKAPDYLPDYKTKYVTITCQDAPTLISGMATVAVINPYDIWIEYSEVGPFAVLTTQTTIELYAILHYNIPTALFATLSFQVTFTVGSFVGTYTVDNTVLSSEEGKKLIKVTMDKSGYTVPTALELTVSFNQQSETSSLFESSKENNVVTKDLHIVEPFPHQTPSFSPAGPMFVISMIGLGIFAYFASRPSGTVRRRFRRIMNDKQGVSPVIAVILMVAITLILVAILWLWISSLLGTDKSTQPTIELVQGTTDDNDAYIVTVKSIDMQTVSVMDLKYILRDPGDQTVLKSGTVDQVYGMPVSDTQIVVFMDNDYNGKVTANDQFKIYISENAGMPGGHFKLVYSPSSKQVKDITLK